ncbi:MAG: FkbM family methyltransferase [Pseudomonadota bacterium]
MKINFQSPEVRVVRTNILGEEILFAVDQPRDLVQSHHLAGRFYEPDELLIMSKGFPVGGRLLDIGANVGNHTIFFGKLMNATRITPIEVNPRVIDLLRTNITINGLLPVCDLSHVGVGFYSETIGGAGIAFRERNIGGARIATEGGELSLVRGEDVLDEPFDLVKIDVEGAEIHVLDGLAGLIASCRPNLFVEVDKENTEAFLNWMVANDYQEVERFQRYRTNTNFLVAPV